MHFTGLSCRTFGSHRFNYCWLPFLYNYMELQNPLSRAGNGIRLIGDTQKAANYIRYAQRKLVELKTFMHMTKTNMMKRVHAADGGCVDIIVQSVAGMDSIFIMACKGGDCKVKVSIVSQSSLDITIEVVYDLGGATKTGELTGWQAFVEWGDSEGVFISGSKKTAKTVSHEYATAGEYNITVRAWNAKLLNSGGSSSSPTTVTGFSKSQITTQDAAGHAATLALPWVITTTATLQAARVWSTAQRVRFGTWANTPGEGGDKGWEMHKTTMSIDLSGEDINNMIGLVHYSGNSPSTEFGKEDPLHRPAIYKNGAHWHTLENLYILSRGDFFEVKDLGSLEGLTEIEFRDLGEYAFPVGHTGEKNYVNKPTSGTFTCTFHPYDCKAEKNITVTVPPTE